MSSGLLIRLQPSGPLRVGLHDGSEGADRILHSDTLYSALTLAIAELDSLEEWLADTARGAEGSSVLLSSCFPYFDDALYVTPPRTVWPPATLGKERWKSARFVPLSVVRSLLEGKPFEEDRWRVDAASECLISTGRLPRSGGPFRITMRQRAAVDRASEGVIAQYATSCLEFRAGAGLWTLAAFADERAEQRWAGVVHAAFRLLGDSGIGGERSSGWGHFRVVEARQAPVMELLAEAIPPIAFNPDHDHNAFWLLSLCSPSPNDEIDWHLGDYTVLERSGRTTGSGLHKKSVRMISEGSVLVAGALQGSARDVAPEGSAHPVYASGFALGLPIPARDTA